MNLKNGNPKSFIISHWLDAHPMSVEPPEFEWKVVDAYSDALRRQLCEGLQILETGSLNKRLEFNNNNLCRMRVSSSNSDLTEKELQRELDKKKEFNGRIKKFISVMSKLSTAIEIKKKNVQNHPMNNLIFCSRSNRGAQFPIKTPLKRKRSVMDTSTPISSRREVKLIEMEEDLPIEKDKSNHSNSYDTSDDKIPLEKVKAGMSGEVNSMVVTPEKELSPDTYERRLALHTMDIARASENNPKVLELHEQNMYRPDLSENPFSKKVTAHVQDANEIFESAGASRQSAGIDGMNKSPLGGEKDGRTVGMDGMNKAPPKGGLLIGLLV